MSGAILAEEQENSDLWMGASNGRVCGKKNEWHSLQKKKKKIKKKKKKKEEEED